MNNQITQTPKVSVLVPIYNNEIYLHECIDSIVNQTLKDIEIILLDDGSTDSSPQICDEYAKKDNRIKVVHKKNTGYGHTMNLGIEMATGEYIGIVESDDYVELDMFESLYNATVQNNQKMDMVKSNHTVFYGDKDNRMFDIKKNIYNSKHYYKILVPSKKPKMIAKDLAYIWSSIYNRSFLIENNIRFNETPGASYQDIGFFFQTYLLAKSFYALDKSFYRLRRDNPNSSIYNKNKVYCICEEYKFIENFLDKHNFDKHIYNAMLYRKFNNYVWTLDKIEQKYRSEFTQEIIKEFKNIDNKNLEFFNKNQKLYFKIVAHNKHIDIQKIGYYNKIDIIVFTSILFFIMLFIFIIIKLLKNKHNQS